MSKKYYQIKMDKAIPDTDYISAIEFEKKQMQEKLQMRLSKETKNKLQKFAEAHNTTASEVIRRLINKLIQ